MHIAINTRFLRANKIEGTGRFTVEIFKRMVANHPEVTFHFLFDGPFDSQFVFANNVVPHRIFPPARHPFLWHIWFYYTLPNFLKQIQPDVFVSPDGLLPKVIEFPSIPVIHDLNFLHFPAFLPKNVYQFYEANFRNGSKKAAHIVTVSEFSKRDIAENLRVPLDLISVVPNAVSSDFMAFSPEEKARFQTLQTNNRPYFLYVGAMNPRKNLERTLQGFDAFASASQRKVDLYLAGAEMYQSDSVKRVLAKMKNKDLVHLLGWLTDEQLQKWLAGANGFVFTSMFEGFGIPILEAFASGVPVLTSHTSAMPEVGGAAAFYADPTSAESIATGLMALHQNGNQRIPYGFKQLNQFSWDKAAVAFWEIIDAVYQATKK